MNIAANINRCASRACTNIANVRELLKNLFRPRILTSVSEVCGDGCSRWWIKSRRYQPMAPPAGILNQMKRIIEICLIFGFEYELMSKCVIRLSVYLRRICRHLSVLCCKVNEITVNSKHFVEKSFDNVNFCENRWTGCWNRD